MKYISHKNRTKTNNLKAVNTITFFVLVFMTELSHGQTSVNSIIFYKPYSDSIDYKDRTVKFDYDTQYANLKNAHIEEDVDIAIKNNDLRIVAISGYSYVFPGLDGGLKRGRNGKKVFIGLSSKYKPYLDKYGYKVIMGTSDVIHSGKVPLQSAAFDYAKAYNTLLLSKQHL